jgi:hypothetical protein
MGSFFLQYEKKYYRRELYSTPSSSILLFYGLCNTKTNRAFLEDQNALRVHDSMMDEKRTVPSLDSDSECR